MCPEFGLGFSLGAVTLLVVTVAYLEYVGYRIRRSASGLYDPK